MEKNQMEQTLVDLAISLLERQLKLAKKCGLTLSSIKESIEKKDFESMETSLNDFNACSIKLNLIEEERSSVFEQLSSLYHLRAGSGFKELIHKVPVSTRKQFEDLYLSLKFNISTLQSTIWVIDS